MFRTDLIYFDSISSYTSLLVNCPVKMSNHIVLFSDSFCQVYRVTDEAFIAETAVD